ncbi:serine/arginine repetitive matrix protein 2, partial [Capsella rubella]
MYNGIGLQTARGSGTNGYVQTNKFLVRPRTGGKPVGKGFEDDQGTAGLSKKPNKAILEHDRKRQIHLKLAILEDKLADQGYSDAEIAQKLEEARLNLEAAAAANEETGGTGDSKISDTQTHQVAARKEKQMEAFRAALGLPDQQQVAEEGIIDDEPAAEAYEGRLKERREHSFLDRDSGRKKLDEEINEKDVKVKESKKQRGDDDMEKVKRHKKKDSKKRRHSESSEESDEHGRDRRRRSKKKAKGRKQESDSES